MVAKSIVQRGEVGRHHMTCVATSCLSVVAWCPFVCLHDLHGLVWFTNTWTVSESRFNLHASRLQEEEVEEFRVSSVSCCCGWQPWVRVHLAPTATLSSACPSSTTPSDLHHPSHLSDPFNFLPACACVWLTLRHQRPSGQTRLTFTTDPLTLRPPPQNKSSSSERKAVIYCQSRSVSWRVWTCRWGFALGSSV